MTEQDWRKMIVGGQDWQEIGEENDNMRETIVRLQERIRALERAREIPDNAFFGQVLFDAFVFVCLVVIFACGG